MSKFWVIAFLVFAFLGAGSVKGQTLTLNYFMASPDGSDVLVSWELPTESGVTGLKLWRKVDSETDYSLMTTLSPNGQMAYQFLDYTLSKDTPRNVSYKLQVLRGGAVYSYYTTIAYNPTSVQRTWGSIKKMFR